MEVILRILRAALIATLAFLCANYLSNQQLALYVFIFVLAIASLNTFLLPASIVTFTLIGWAGLHFIGIVPNLTGVKTWANTQNPTSLANGVSTLPLSRTLDARLNSLEKARNSRLVTESEYKLIRNDIIQDEIHSE